MNSNRDNCAQLAKLIRYWCLTATTAAGSGHPTSSLSAVDLMAMLMFGGFFCFDLEHPEYPNNDRLIFSKGHASPLFYALWAAAGAIQKEELLTLRKFGSRLEGHPTMEFPFTEAATGSLGQGLSIGVGMALNAKIDKLPYRNFVLLGDSEMSEGQCFEALSSASHYKLNNLCGIIDVNRLGQRGETMYGHNTEEYEKRVRAFGWDTAVIDGHNLDEINNAFTRASKAKEKPFMIIARTLKGKGVSFLEDKDGWHGKVLSSVDLQKALQEIGEVNVSLRGVMAKPKKEQFSNKSQIPNSIFHIPYSAQTPIATRKAYGNALVRIFPKFPQMVVLDAEVSNSTFSETFKKEYPERFFEMYIAEQNMVGVALGLSRRGKKPFVSTFAAFLTRAADQIRMCQYSNANIVFCGSHSGVSIGEDGASQMALEDIAMFRAILGSVVLYPSDAVSTEKLVETAASLNGISYIRTTRADTPILYGASEKFTIGKSKTLRQSENDVATVAAAGITLHQALEAYNELLKDGIKIRVIDCYSIKPIDSSSLKKAAQETRIIITVEDHYAEGGLGEAVLHALQDCQSLVYTMAVSKMPHSGTMPELLDYEEISKNAIIKKIKEMLINFNKKTRAEARILFRQHV